AAAETAFASFGWSTKEERAKVLHRLHEAASAHLDDLTAAMVEKYGGVVQFAGLYDSEDEAIRIANDSNYGLHADVLGADLRRARRVASQISGGARRDQQHDGWSAGTLGRIQIFRSRP